MRYIHGTNELKLKKDKVSIEMGSKNTGDSLRISSLPSARS